MAVEILTQSEGMSAAGSSSLAEFSVLYGEKAVAEAQARLQVVLEFRSLKPKTTLSNGRPKPSPVVEELARKTGVSLGTLRRWYYLYRSGYVTAQGSAHAKAKAGFEALISRP